MTLPADPLICLCCNGPKFYGQERCDNCRDLIEKALPKEPPLRDPTESEGADRGDEHFGAD